MTKLEHRIRNNIISIIKSISDDDFERCCKYLGIVDDDLVLLKLRYRSHPSYTREYVAEELGISTSTLDRRIDELFLKIFSYRITLSNILSLCKDSYKVTPVSS